MDRTKKAHYFVIAAVAISAAVCPPRAAAFAPSPGSTIRAAAAAARGTMFPLLLAFGGGPTKTANPSSRSLSPLPKGISPFEKSISKSIDVQADFRRTAKRAIDAAIVDGVARIEIEFPPLIGGSQSKSQFDDFDNVQELDKNKDWTMLLAPMFLGDEKYQNGKTWLIFPDLKECELAKMEWAGKRYREATFTTIEAVTGHVVATTGGSSNGGAGGGAGGYDAPWGSSLMSGISKMMGGGGGRRCRVARRYGRIGPESRGGELPRNSMARGTAGQRRTGGGLG